MVTVHILYATFGKLQVKMSFFQSKSTQPPVVTYATCPMALNVMYMATGNKTKGMCEKSHIPLPFCHSEK